MTQVSTSRHPISVTGLRAIAAKQFGINDPDLCAELASELLSLRQSHSTGAVVKGLEWDDDLGPDEQTAFPIFGQYFIRHNDVAYELRLNYASGADMYQTFFGIFGSWDEAKAAAQSDYERRILSALYTHPKEAEVTVTEEMVERAVAAWEATFLPAFPTPISTTSRTAMRAALVAALSRKG